MIKSYVVFRLQADQYAFPVTLVREVVPWFDPAKIPRTTNLLEGMINLRGTVLPVLNLRVRLGLESKTQMVPRRFIAILEMNAETEPFTFGVVIDQIVEVLEINDDEIERAPNFGLQMRDDFVTGILSRENATIILLNAEMVCDIRELATQIITPVPG